MWGWITAVVIFIAYCGAAMKQSRYRKTLICLALRDPDPHTHKSLAVVVDSSAVLVRSDLRDLKCSGIVREYSTRDGTHYYELADTVRKLELVE